MSAGCGSIGREQSDPAPLQSNIMSCWSVLNCRHLFHKATRCIVLVQREEGGRGEQRFVSMANLHSGCGLVQPLRNLHQIRLLTASACNAPLEEPFVWSVLSVSCLIQYAGDSVNPRLHLLICRYEMWFILSVGPASAANANNFHNWFYIICVVWDQLINSLHRQDREVR